MDEYKTVNNQEINETRGVRVFVYGTLKRGHYNHTLLERGKAEFLGRHVISGHYRMLDLTAYPAVVRTSSIPDRPTGRIVGEVYRVSNETLDSLDILEGHPNHFRREKVWTPWKNAWMYFAPVSAYGQIKEHDTGIWEPMEDELEWYAGRTGEASGKAVV